MTHMLHYPSLNEFHKSDELYIGAKEPFQFQAMHSFFIFLYNVDHDFIKQVWGGTYLEDHLRAKLKAKVNVSNDNFMSPNILMSFIADLDDENRKKLYAYIMKRHVK